MINSKEDIALTKEKWEKAYKEIKDCNFALDNSDYKYIKKYLEAKGLFLELGCGLARNSFLLAKKGYQIVGLDLSLSAVKLAKDNFDKYSVRGFFVCGDMLHMPFKSNIFHSIFAGGSIEHFKDTELALREIYAIIAKGGTFLATVPVISLSQLTYGQLTGDIPDILLLKNILYFIHTKFFRNKLMRYGYQKSFFVGKIYKLFKNVGFTNIEYGNYDTDWEIKFFKNRTIKKILNQIAHLRLFWPFIFIKGDKIAIKY